MLTYEQREFVLKRVKQREHVATLAIEHEFVATPQCVKAYEENMAKLNESITHLPNAGLAPVQRPPYLLSDPDGKFSILGVYVDVMDEKEVDEAIAMSFSKL